MNSRFRILVVEDDAAIRRGIVDALVVSGYEVVEAVDGISARDAIACDPFDLALLDVVFPHGNGFDLLKQLRDAHAAVPAIMLTAKGDESDRVRGLRLGADDYVVKPFSILELLARIEAVLRRSPERPGEIDRLIFPNGAKVDFRSREIRSRGGNVERLTVREFELLRHLAANAGRVVSREEILTRVWHSNPRLVETRGIDTTLARLREKLGESNGAAIRTIRGQGYIFSAKIGK